MRNRHVNSVALAIVLDFDAHATLNIASGGHTPSALEVRFDKILVGKPAGVAGGNGHLKALVVVAQRLVQQFVKFLVAQLLAKQMDAAMLLLGSLRLQRRLPDQQADTRDNEHPMSQFLPR